jgi:hypothetical protein
MRAVFDRMAGSVSAAPNALQPGEPVERSLQRQRR